MQSLSTLDDYNFSNGQSLSRDVEALFRIGSSLKQHDLLP